MVLPMPTAGPPTAATTGFFMFGSEQELARARHPACVEHSRKSPTSLPAVKQLGAAAGDRLHLRSASAAAARRRASVHLGRDRVFLSSRSKRMRATRPWVSLLIKTVILELLPQRELGELRLAVWGSSFTKTTSSGIHHFAILPS